MMFPRQPVELHKIVCPFLTFNYGTEQEVLLDMRVAPWKSQICIPTSDRLNLPYCRENLYSSHYLRSGVNYVFVGRHRNRLLLNEDRRIMYKTPTHALFHSTLYYSSVLITLKYTKIFNSTPTCFDLKRSSSGSMTVPC